MHSSYFVITFLVFTLREFFIQSVAGHSNYTESGDKQLRPLDQSGWRTINRSATLDTTNNGLTRRYWQTGEQHLKRPLTVQWDDDETTNENLEDAPDRKSTGEELQNLEENQEAWKQVERPKPRKMSGKLIYHGQVAQNGSYRIVDGIKFYIDTHRPVKINRHHLSRVNEPTKSISMRQYHQHETGISKRSNEDRHQSAFDGKEESSEWKPIVMKMCPGCEKSRVNNDHIKEDVATQMLQASYKIDEDIKESNYKWKPIRLETAIPKKQTESKDDSEPPNESQKTSAFRDDTDQHPVVIENPKHLSGSRRGEARWAPVVTTTESTSGIADRDTMSTGNQSSSGNSSHLDSAQKSASDLNYIYSSQQAPVQTEMLSGSQQTYSNYQQSSSGVNDMQANPTGATIIDTTSGQVPEMVVARALDSGFVIGQDVAQVPLRSTRTLVRPYSYDSGSYYAKPQQAPRFVPQTTVAPVIRQEHHYHYYNQQPQPQQQQNNDRQLPPSQVIRELQPLLIAQPFVQPQVASSTVAPTPPPQIIREIIKEVPVQSMQNYVMPSANRVIIPLPPPMQLREVDTNLGYSPLYSIPAQRIIKQLSIPPAVAARIPQIRLPSMSALQLPTRSAPVGVTRQTGSFIIPPVPQKTTTYLTETQAMPTHTTIMHTTQYTPATRTTVYTTDHQAEPQNLRAQSAYKK